MSPPVHPAARAVRRRGPVRRYLETRGLVGGHARANVTTRLRSADGTGLVGSYLPGPPAADAAVLLVHGFAANRRKPAYARLADGLAERAPVLALDLRGHGASGGSCTLGDREAGDVAAGVEWLRRFGHRRVVLVGLSMGATASLHAASRGLDVAGVVAVSAPAYFLEQPETDPMRRLQRLWESPLQRAALQALLGVSLSGPDGWSSPPDPVDMVREIEAPVLIVHGEDDAYFPPSDAEALAAAVAGPAVLWREPAGFGHAEDGVTPAFVDALGGAIGVALATGRFPARRDAR